MTAARCGAEITVAGGRYYWTCRCGVDGPAGGYRTSVTASKDWAAHVAGRRAALLQAFGACALCGAPRAPDPQEHQPAVARRLVCTACGEPAHVDPVPQGGHP